MTARNLALIVDDAELNREILTDILHEEFELETAENGLQALEILEKRISEIAVLLLDLVMPEMDGIRLMEEIQARGWSRKFPILIISGEWTPDIEQACFRLGATDYIRKPFNEMLVRTRTRNAAVLFNYQNSLEEQVNQQTEQLRAQNRRLIDINDNIIMLLGDIVEARDSESGLHIRRVRGFVRILAEEMMARYPEYGLTEEKIQAIVSASALHDIGKIMTPDAILLKPGALTPEEFEIIKQHTVHGAQILDRSRDIWQDEALYRAGREICLHHHEKYDGRGYPDKLKGDEIPISAQIVAAADCYDALIKERVYKPPYSKAQAFQMLMNGECGVFNPKLLTVLSACRERIEALADEHADEPEKGE